MKKLLLLFIFSTFSLFAQHKGIILDQENNLPVEGVSVYFSKSSPLEISDKNGNYNLITPSGNHKKDTVYFSHIGYKTQAIVFNKLKENNFTLFLAMDMEKMNELIVYSHKVLHPQIRFTKLKPLKNKISSFGSLFLNDKIYIIGGDGSFQTDAWKKVKSEKPDFTIDDYLNELKYQFSNNIYKDNLLIYDIKRDNWEIPDLKFHKRAYHNLNYYDNKIYVLGGKRVSTNGKFEYLENTIEVFDTSNNTITLDKANPHQAVNFVSFTYTNNIIVMGGSTKSNDQKQKVYSNKIHSYDLKTGYWYEIGTMPTAKETSGVLIGDKIYLVGGYKNKPLTEIETYDLITGKWEKEGDLFYGIQNPALTFYEDTIFIYENGKISTYDIKTKVLKEFLINLPLKGSTLYYAEDNLYLLGGFIENDYSTYPSDEFVKIAISEFANTKVNRSKRL